MKVILLAAAIAGVLPMSARAADGELSLETRQMLAYGTLAVLTGVCKTPLTAAQSAQIKTGLEKAAKAQQELTEADFTAQMKGAGAQIGENREQVCAAVTPEFVANSLEEAADGR